MEEVIRQYPRSAWVDDARFWSCYSLEKLNQPLEKVFQCYQDFIRAYPDSEWVKDAKSNMVRLSQALAKAGKPEYGTVIKSLESGGEDEDIRMTALYALQNIGDEEALKTILGLYDKAESRKLKQQIVFMLQDMETPEALAKLADIARKEPDEDVRRAALFALGGHGGPEAVAILKDVLKSDAPADLRRNALFALAEAKDPGTAGPPDRRRPEGRRQGDGPGRGLRHPGHRGSGGRRRPPPDPGRGGGRRDPEGCALLARRPQGRRRPAAAQGRHRQGDGPRARPGRPLPGRGDQERRRRSRS